MLRKKIGYLKVFKLNDDAQGQYHVDAVVTLNNIQC